ncbi:hypothetical protein ACFPFP_18735 [Bradyrhizobium sp. GCM10023182]|uniref:Serine protease n=1 Tax=Bradyrhizobium zhengyangense TaxID=2911009 RepID=A0ABS9LPP9_9BRAD|nr:hypothetical protein [Bradyrhizobium zhengyangense]MCG2668992.1 hypothetical protein [Bradyrhizobium zhengyangense]
MREIKLATAQFGAAIASFMVGFVKLSVSNGVERADCAGSGTLVSVGGVRGILTAAHVLENLPDRGQVGIVDFLGETIHYRKRLIDMAGAKKIKIGGENEAADGRDLGFLRLPQEALGWFGGLNSFYDLKTHRDDLSEVHPPAPHHVHAVVGLINERTKDLPADRPGERRAGFEAVFSDGAIVKTERKNEFDLIEFAPKVYPDTNLPSSFEGTSGGALWRIFFDIDQDQAKVIASRLWGIPFQQSLPSQAGVRTLTCHAITGVYGTLMDLITNEWPEESAR